MALLLFIFLEDICPEQNYSEFEGEVYANIHMRLVITYTKGPKDF